MYTKAIEHNSKRIAFKVKYSGRVTIKINY